MTLTGVNNNSSSHSLYRLFLLCFEAQGTMSEPATPKGEISLLGDHFDRSVALQDEEEAMMLEFSDATASPALAAAPQEQAAAAPIPNSYGPDYLPGDLTCVALASGTVEFDEQDMVALGEAVM